MCHKMKRVVGLLFALFLWIPMMRVHALSEGIYVAQTEKSPFVYAFKWEDNRLAVTVQLVPEYMTEYLELSNLSTQSGSLFMSLLDPNMSAEELAKKRKELGLDVDLEKYYEEVKQLTTAEEIIEFTYRTFPGVYARVTPVGQTEFLFNGGLELREQQNNQVAIHQFGKTIFIMTESDETGFTYKGVRYELVDHQ